MILTKPPKQVIVTDLELVIDCNKTRSRQGFENIYISGNQKSGLILS